jgi:ADP-ribose pyrophosphatase YjhB (NUDIX family)
VNDYPNRPLVGVGVVAIKDGRVLLIRRAKPPRAGRWSLPGGRQRLGDEILWWFRIRRGLHASTRRE